jgi:hypothetical protein
MTVRGGDALTTIPLRKATRDRLKQLGGKGETYDDILNRLIDLANPLKRQRVLSKEPPDLVDFEPLD